MAEKTLERGEATLTREEISQLSEPNGESGIEVSGEAAIIADAILDLAASIRLMASAIKDATNTEEDENDQNDNPQRYLDGRPIKK